MNVYDFLDTVQEWAKNPKSHHQSDTEQAASLYVRGIAPQLFDSILTKDLETLLDARNKFDDMAVFAGIDLKTFDSNPTPEAAIFRRQKKIITDFIKAVIREVESHNFCSPQQIEYWRDRYGVKLHGLKAVPDVGAEPSKAPQRILGREGLFIRKRDVRPVEFAEVIRQLIENGVLYSTESNSDYKMQAVFKSFLIGAGEQEVKAFPHTYRMTTNETKRFLCFVSLLYDNVKDRDPELIKKGNKWALVKDWFQNAQGETYTQDSLNTLASQGRTQYLSDGSIKEIAIKVANILADN